jgi:AraC-like DNA-binding protein
MKDFFVEYVSSADLSKTNDVNAGLAHQEMLLQTINGMAVDLLTSEMADFSGTLQESLSTMARCVDVDRAYIWRNEIRDGKHCYIQLFEWVDNESSRGTTVHSRTGFSYIESFPEWDDKFRQRQCISGPVSILSPVDQGRLLFYGIKSILVIPVFLQDNFWGFVSFDDCRKERGFTDTEIDILQSGSLLLANALVHGEMNEEIERRDVMLRTINTAATIMLRSEGYTFEKDMLQCMEMMGRSIGADRMRIWRNHSAIHSGAMYGELSCTLIYGWIAEGVEPLIGKPITQNVSYSKSLPGWEGTLSKGKCINSIVKNALIYIHENYDNDIKIYSLAAELGVCKEHLIRSFQQVVGKSPKEYIIHCRIRQAILLMQNDREITIGEISNKCGYLDVSYFSRCFKKVTGTSPNSYRKTH